VSLGLCTCFAQAGNILLDSSGALWLADFGVSARMFDTGDRQLSRKTFVGTCGEGPTMTFGAPQAPVCLSPLAFSSVSTCLSLSTSKLVQYSM